jgi:hypothetical protein
MGSNPSGGTIIDNPVRDYIDELGLHQRFLVIGNGPLAPIDFTQYSAIVRFNNYELSHEAGWCTTHWVTCAWFNVQERPMPYGIVPWSSTAPASYAAGSFKRPLVFTPNDDHIIRFFPFAFDYTEWTTQFWPTTGFCFLALLNYHGLTNYDITGFDGLKTGHYWDPNHKHGHNTTRDIEFALIRRMVPKIL